MRLIDADAFKIKGVPEESLEFDAGVIYVLDCLANAPTIDAVPVKHGKWERVIEQPFMRKHFHTVCCSVCKGKGYERYKYCPNCGARMYEE